MQLITLTTFIIQVNASQGACARWNSSNEGSYLAIECE